MFEKLKEDSPSQFHTGNFTQDPARAFPSNIVRKKRKADQWMMLTREAAKFFVENTRYLDKLINKKTIAVDERYFVELMEVNGLPWVDQCSTYCNWKSKNPPMKFDVYDQKEWTKARNKGCMFLRQVTSKRDIQSEIMKDITRNAQNVPRSQIPRHNRERF